MFSAQAKSTKDLEKIAGELIGSFPGKHVFAFYGKMGAGKTTLIQAICRHLGSADNITSPTFALINEYNAPGNRLLYHFDFYRINKIEEVFDLGYEDYFYSENYCFIEWPEKVEHLLPPDMVKVTIEVTENEVRLINANKD